MTDSVSPSRPRPIGNVLVVYGLFTHPLRSTIEDHLLAFRRYSAGRVFHLNARVQDVPAHILRRRFDLIVFQTTFLSSRWAPELFLEMCDRMQPLKALSGVRVAMPQDEFLHTKLVCDFIDDFRIDVVCSVAPESEWPKIYPRLDRDRVRFHRVLTGYLDDRTVDRIDQIAAATPAQDVDIGYRAWRGASWLGRHGTLKGTIADAVNARGAGRRLRLDVSTRDEDTLLGDDWFRFLARCRYTIGIEGGASVLDYNGAIKDRTERYQAEHPGASFDEIEAACFPGEDGRLALFAISPRHLEACATRTCQVLVEGGYNGILQPDRHYIELRADLSNLEAVLDSLADEERRRRIVETAYRDVVASGRYTYRAMVADVERFVVAGAPAAARGDRVALAVNRLAERAAWARVAVAARWRPRLGATRLGRLAAGLRARRDGRPRDAAVTTVVSVTPLAVERDSRTFKIAASVARLGYRSIVVEAEPSASPRDDLPFELLTVPGRHTRREPPQPPSPDGPGPRPRGLPLGPLAARLPAPVRRAVEQAYRALLPLAAYPFRCYAIAATLPSADLYYLHSHYPFPSVWWRARAGRKPFIYDAHDLYWTHRVDVRPFTVFDRVTWWVWDSVEWLSARRAAACVTVGEGVARHAQERFKRTFAVVRNLHDGRLDLRGAPGIRAHIGVGADAFVIVAPGNFKAGMVAVGCMLRALADLPERVHVAFLGAGYDGWMAAAEELGLAERVHFVRPVPPTEVVPLLADADLAAVLYLPTTVNVRHALPNRFFLAIAAGLPVLYPAQLEDVRTLAERYGVGWAIDPQDAGSIRSAVASILAAPEEFSRRRGRVRAVRPELSWAADEAELARVLTGALAGDGSR